jgi:drug/metabolite transporter (DMT)-like permease
MLPSVILGLVAAVSWGVADFVARYTAREIGAYRSLFFMQAFGLGLLSAVYWAGDPKTASHAPAVAWDWAAVAGILSAAAVLALYRSFEVGTLAVVAPISAGYPALTALLSIGSGERVSAARWVGIGLVLVGVALTVGAAKSPETDNGKGTQNPRAGIGWALAAAMGFGVMFWVLGFHVVPALGGLLSVWVVRLVATLALGVMAWPARQSLQLPRGSVFWMVMAIGILDVCAYLANNFGVEFHHVSIVTVLASLYAAVTVVLAAAVLREKLNGKQWVGIALIFLGVIVLSA